MKGADAIAEILKREGVENLFAYPVNPLIEACAVAGIRTIICRQEGPGLYMADGFSRISCGRRIGVFTMQWGPGSENAFGGVAQAYGESVPILVLAGGHARHLCNIPPNFNASINYRHVTKWIEPVILGSIIPDAMRRAFSQVKNGRPGPALVEIPRDIFDAEVEEPLTYQPTFATRTAPDPQDVSKVAEILLHARRPVIYAGQGVHYGQAWPQLHKLAERLAAPVTTSLSGKSAFPENHPLALGSCGRSYPGTVHEFLGNADVIFGIGCSFSRGLCTVPVPSGKTVIHATLDPADLNKDIAPTQMLLGDAALTLDGLLAEIDQRLGRTDRSEQAQKVAGQIKKVKTAWMADWLAKLTSDEVPLSPYRILWDLSHTVDRANTIITHDSGSPRDQLSPFWESPTPLSYIGWGKTTQLGYGLGLAMGAKLAEPGKLCINVMGDAAIGMTGMDFETAVRERIPILTIVMNNFSMACEIPIMPVSTEKYRASDISGNYADLATALGGYGQRVREPARIVPAIKEAIRKTEEGTPTLLEFITKQEIAFSSFK